MHRLGLFIGVDRYLRIEPPLECAAADARLLAEKFRDHLGFDTEVLTHDDLGYGGNIRSINDILGQWEKRVKEQPGGILVVFFAGHGTTTDDGEHLLLLPTASPKVLESRKASGEGIRTDAELFAETRDWPGIQRLFIFDACRSPLGRMPRPQGVIGGRDPRPTPPLPTGLTQLKSCQDWEISHELSNYDGKGTGHGLFTAALSEEIEAASRIERPLVVDEELNSRLAQRMKALAKLGQGEQQLAAAAQLPVCKGDPIRLMGLEDRREIRLRRLLADFEQQLVAGQFSRPPGLCCRDTLNRLIALNLDSAAAGNLSARLQAAEDTEERQRHKEADDRLIALARQLRTTEAYTKYLIDSRLREYETEAQDFIQQHARQGDEDAWAEAKRTATVDSYRIYLARYPQGSHADDARQEIKRLEQDAQATAEAQAWKAAQGSLERLRAFREQWPQSVHRQDADTAIAALEQQAALTRDDERLREALRKTDSTALKALMGELETDDYRQRAKTELTAQEKREEEARQRQADEEAQRRDKTRWEKAENGTMETCQTLLPSMETPRYRQLIEKRIRQLTPRKPLPPIAKKALMAFGGLSFLAVVAAFWVVTEIAAEGEEKNEFLSLPPETTAVSPVPTFGVPATPPTGRANAKPDSGLSDPAKQQALLEAQQRIRALNDNLQNLIKLRELKSGEKSDYNFGPLPATDTQEGAELALRLLEERIEQLKRSPSAVSPAPTFTAQQIAKKEVEKLQRPIALEMADGAKRESSKEFVPKNIGIVEKREKRETYEIYNATATIYFPTGGFTLSKDTKDLLATLKDKLTDVKLEVIILVGHADKQEDSDTNRLENLSQKRADAAKNYLSSLGITAARLYPEGKGYLVTSKEGGAFNRRVEIEVIGTISAPTATSTTGQTASGKEEAERQLHPPALRANFQAGKIFRDKLSDGSLGPEMVMIQAGREMKANALKSEDEAHIVRIAQNFALGKTEVTQAQWRQVMGNNPSHFPGCDDCPVEQVNLADAQAFVKKLSMLTGQSYRLPSEAEWEYACRAGELHTYCGGNDINSVAWFDLNSGGKTQPVAGKRPNAWGLYDMSGNVWEWVQDCWQDKWTTGCRPGVHVMRGGAWANIEGKARATYRISISPTHRNVNFGFRLAKTL